MSYQVSSAFKFFVFCSLTFFRKSFFRASFFGALFFASSVFAESVDISEFGPNYTENWEAHSFEGDTQYSLKQDGGAYLSAKSVAAASGLVRKIEVDLKKTPVLNWRWRLNERLPELKEQEKDGDDYAARLYVVVSGGFFFWKTKALNLVWSSRDAKGQSWPNAFAPDNAKMVAVRGVNDASGQWYEERVNVAELLEQWLGEDIEQIDAVAIMTDTDNSGLSASADYADIRFTSN